MEDYEFKISQLIDNELPTEEQEELFLFLSQNEDGRKIFTDFMNMKKEAKSYYSGITTELDEPKIVAADLSLSNKNEMKYKGSFYFAAAASIILAFLLASNIIKENPFKTKYENLQAEFVVLQQDYSNVLNEQAELINVNNSFVKKLLKIGNEKLDKKVANKRKEPSKQNIEKNSSSKIIKSGSMLASLQNVQTIEITKNDFLGGQIIGN